jgi:galactokinase
MRAAESLARDPAALVAELARLVSTVAADRDAVRVVRAPGRVNLIGEHTDYNDGLVLPMAIDLGIAIALLPTDDGRVELTLEDGGERAAIELDTLPRPTGTWRDYVAGMAWALRDAGVPVRGFRGLLSADLPMGMGLSSSAALELAVAWALGGGAAPLDDRMALAQLAQRAENDFVGVPCGLMDQFAIAFGRAGAALLLDCRTLEHRAVTIPAELAVVVCDSGLSRRLATSGYAERRDECARAVRQLRAIEPSVRSLRDVDGELLARGRAHMDDVAFRRARHVVTENARVMAAVAALEAGDGIAIGRAVSASHASLRDDFAVSTPELDRLVEAAESTPGVLGARLTGAGFGGCTVSIVEAGGVAALVERLEALGRFDGADRAVRAFEVRPSDGVRAVWP